MRRSKVLYAIITITIFQIINSINLLGIIISSSHNITHFNETFLLDGPLKYWNLSLVQNIDVRKDVLVFLHIQKTGGTNFEEKFFSDILINLGLQWQHGCIHMKKRYICQQNKWFISFFWDRYLSRYCDIHAGYAELINCVNNRTNKFNNLKKFIFTFLRNPVNRYISELKHVQRGATWNKSVRACLNQDLYQHKCYQGLNWTDATIDSFLTCEYNLANNRQVRMLADYNELGCDILKCFTKNGGCYQTQKEQNEKLILESAKKTLLSISFFGLNEYQRLSGKLFEKTFEGALKFAKPFEEKTQTEAYNVISIYSGYIDEIKKKNHLDIQLYEFAHDLFFQRLKYFKIFK